MGFVPTRENVVDLHLLLLVEGFNFERYVFDVQLIETALQHVSQGYGRREGDLHRGVGVAGVHVVQPHGRCAALETDLPFHQKAARPHGALSGVDCGEDTHLQKKRREESIVHHLHVVVRPPAVRAGHIYRNWNHNGAPAELSGDGCIAILRNGSHQFASRGNFEGVRKGGQQRQNFRAGKRQISRSYRKEAVPEGVDALAVDVGDSAVGADA